ncbi:hypothetical protein Bca4012_094625 [Brassica carinata]
MEGSLVLALMLDEASSPVSRLSPTKLESSMLVPRKVENPHYIQQPYFKIHLSEGFSFKNLRGYLLCRALDGRQTYIFLVDGGLRQRSPAYVQLLHFQTMGQEHAQGPESFRYEGINRWENMNGLENSTVTSVENYTVMKWHVDCLHYTRVPFNYHI